jgi:hypothetical protein
MSNNKLQVSTSATQSITALTASGFLVTRVGAESGTAKLAPVSRVAFRKANKLTNSEAKRQYAGQMDKFTAAMSADFAFHASSMHGKGIAVSATGVRTYKLTEPLADVPAPAVAAPVTTEAAMAALGITPEMMAALKAMAVPAV